MVVCVRDDVVLAVLDALEQAELRLFLQCSSDAAVFLMHMMAAFAKLQDLPCVEIARHDDMMRRVPVHAKHGARCIRRWLFDADAHIRILAADLDLIHLVEIAWERDGNCELEATDAQALAVALHALRRHGELDASCLLDGLAPGVFSQDLIRYR